jgi:hypothetical protein
MKISGIAITSMSGFLWLGGTNASGQSVIAPPPEPPLTQIEVQAEAQSQVAANQNPLVFSDENDALPPLPPSPFLVGPVTIEPHILYRLMYSEGIQAAPGHPVDSVIQNVAPGILLALGTHWNLDYTPTWNYYSNHDFRNTLDEAINFTGGANFENWTFGLTQSYVSSSPSLVETATQTKEQTYVTLFTANYQFGRSVELDSILKQNVQLVELYPSYRDWSDAEQLHYQYSTVLNVAAGFVAGYTAVNPGVNMTYGEPEVILVWNATDKLTISLNAGVESRKFHTEGVGVLNSAVFNGSITYQPIKTTQIIVSGERDVSPSYLIDQVTETLQWNLALKQRILKRLYLTAQFAIERVDYLSSAGNSAADRRDMVNSLNIMLSTQLFRRCSVDVFWQNGNNSSNAPGFGYSSNQIGTDISIRY